MVLTVEDTGYCSPSRRGLAADLGTPPRRLGRADDGALLPVIRLPVRLLARAAAVEGVVAPRAAPHPPAALRAVAVHQISNLVSGTLAGCNLCEKTQDLLLGPLKLLGVP